MNYQRHVVCRPSWWALPLRLLFISPSPLQPHWPPCCSFNTPSILPSQGLSIVCWPRNLSPERSTWLISLLLLNPWTKLTSSQWLHLILTTLINRATCFLFPPQCAWSILPGSAFSSSNSTYYYLRYYIIYLFVNIYCLSSLSTHNNISSTEAGNFVCLIYCCFPSS